jgi:hypothetical protein
VGSGRGRHGGCGAPVAAFGRQSLYKLLERIEALLGFPVAGGAIHRSLVAATAAYRLRSGAANRGNSSA